MSVKSGGGGNITPYSDCNCCPQDLPPGSYGVMVYQGDEWEFLPCPGPNMVLGTDSQGNIAWLPYPANAVA